MASQPPPEIKPATDFIKNLVAIVRDDSRYASTICAIEIGGSFGRQEADRYSDLDLFLYIGEKNLTRFMNSIALELIVSAGHPRIVWGPTYKHSFGWGYTVDYSRYGLVSFIFRSDKELVANAMRTSGAPIAYDRDGRLTAVVSTASENPPVPVADLTRNARAACYVRLLHVNKEIARRNEWQARKYYREVLEQVLVMSRLATDKIPRGRNYRQAGRAMERDLPAGLVSRIKTLDKASTLEITPELLWETIDLIRELEDKLHIEESIDWAAHGNRVITGLAEPT